MKGGGGEGSASAHESALDLKDGRLKKKKDVKKNQTWLLFILHVLPESSFFSWQTGGVRTKAANTTVTQQDSLASSTFHFFKLIYLYLICLLELD